ncbi:LOW QUALITY PROTEIN: angiopoietin-4 [Erythrolamprus reginae]|uniref:LOW QUALITY PROTEIN: angiopoietin-4 n=1 Tax=Erythrolamprus reginae TaxID=121349 RepID=UPI00396C6413
MQVFLLALGALLAARGARGSQRRASEGVFRRRAHRVQQGRCTYTFVLPEAEPAPCHSPAGDPPGIHAPAAGLPREPFPASDGGPQASPKVRQLERILENNTQWLMKLENFIQMNIKTEMAHIQQNVVQNQTAAILEIGTNLLSQTAEQTRKLTDVETQVLNQTSRIEIQLLENSLSTNKLEQQLLVQTSEIHKLQDQNSILETRVRQMETKHLKELEDIRTEKDQLQQLVSHQSNTIDGLEKSLHVASSNASLLQQQQLHLLESVQNLVSMVSQGKVLLKKDDRMFQDCMAILQAGFNLSGVYTIHINNLTEPKKAFCDMETDGGGWTVIQRRINGSVSFQKTWKDYKQGFGAAAGEYWLGNEAVHYLTGQAPYTLRVELLDWEGNRAYAQYDKVRLAGERQRYRLALKGYKGSAGLQSALPLQGTSFSTWDSDNDNCMCKCAQMLSGGWWFDACGQSNLNGIYYPARHNIRKLNGVRWHYFQGPGYSLKATRMMIRPSSGREGA